MFSRACARPGALTKNRQFAPIPLTVYPAFSSFKCCTAIHEGSLYSTSTDPVRTPGSNRRWPLPPARS